jgi:hypothetical protein
VLGILGQQHRLMEKTSSASFRETACRAQFFSAFPRSQSKPASRAAKAEKSVTLKVYADHIQRARGFAATVHCCLDAPNAH